MHSATRKVLSIARSQNVSVSWPNHPKLTLSSHNRCVPLSPVCRRLGIVGWHTYIHICIHIYIQRYILKPNLVVYEVGIHLWTCDICNSKGNMQPQPAANRNYINLDPHITCSREAKIPILKLVESQSMRSSSTVVGRLRSSKMEHSYKDTSSRNQTQLWGIYI